VQYDNDEDQAEKERMQIFTDAAKRGLLDRRRRFCVTRRGSLTSQRVRCTSGPENFQSSAKKDFFNTIGAKRTFSETPETPKMPCDQFPQMDRKRAAGP